MGKIRIIKEKNLISVNDMLDYLSVLNNYSNERKRKLKWDFMQLILKKIHKDYKNNFKFNHFYVITGNDSFLNWSYFYDLRNLIKSDNFSSIIDFIDPLMYELNKDKFTEVYFKL